MPVASYKQGPHTIGPKDFPAPKKASVAAWWRAVRKCIPELPRWEDLETLHPKVYIDYETIHASWGDHDLYIARKRSLR